METKASTLVSMRPFRITPANNLATGQPTYQGFAPAGKPVGRLHRPRLQKKV